MNKKKKIIPLLLCLLLFCTILGGCGSGGQAGEKSGQGDTASEQNGESPEKKTEYHVGDVIMDGDMKIVYTASGEYTESNEFMQPEKGNKLVFIRLSFENQGDSVESVTSFSFEGYADGYNVEQHYSDENDLSLNLSPGRTGEGMLIFEVPANASQIEIEYETNMFSQEKIKFIYDGNKDSGYEQNVNKSSSENTVSPGETVEDDNLRISYLSCERDKSYSSFSAPDSGYHYVTLTFEFENNGSGDEYVSYYDFRCYADGKECKAEYFRDDMLSAELSSGRKAKGTVTFSVPDSASVTEVEFISNYWTSDRVIFNANV